MTNERRIDRMRGCACLGKSMLGFVAVAFAVYCALYLRQGFMITCYASPIDQVIARDLKISIGAFKLEYGRFPVNNDSTSTDAHLKSRGQWIDEICSSTNAKLNFKKITFVELPMARERKFGLWRDGEEWVLSDSWGEPYHLILDTNEDKMITNPEFGADQSNPKYAEKCRQSPRPPTLPAAVLIYSSGPDRDPTTWNDNICSWRN